MAAIQRLLALVAGKIQEYVPLQVASGGDDSGKIVALNSSNTIDLSFMPNGIGPDVKVITASEALAAGAYVNIWNNAGAFAVRNADGSASGKQADGYVLSAVASGAQATVYLAGLNTAVSGQTPGLVFLSNSAAGAGAATGATVAGQTFQQLGIAVSATTVQFDPQMPVLRA